MYDMIIGGGGPAGAVAAERAAKKGFSVLVLEKGTYPRDKTSGGCFAEGAGRDWGIDKKLIECEVFSVQGSSCRITRASQAC